MKQFNQFVHKTMGSLPPVLFQYIDKKNIKTATSEFVTFFDGVANDFHAQLANKKWEEIKLSNKLLFGQNVKFDYVASGTVGSVYRVQIGDKTFALKINRLPELGELLTLPLQKRARNLVNKTYIGSVFEFGGIKYTWALSDYVAHNRENSFERAIEKMYYLYLTKGIEVIDAHYNNFKDGKLIDAPSLTRHRGWYLDIQMLTRSEIDIVKKLVNYIKTDNINDFVNLAKKTTVSNPGVIKYMYLAMRFGKRLSIDRTTPFTEKLKKFEVAIDSSKQEITPEKWQQLLSHTRS